MNYIINRVGDSAFIRLSILPGFIADLTLTDVFQCIFYGISIYALWFDLRRSKGSKISVIQRFVNIFKKNLKK